MTKCREIMKDDVECLSLSDAAANAARKMRNQNVGFLPVCDGRRKVLGTVTDAISRSAWSPISAPLARLWSTS
jgi:CBS-domain-containing membrane protein